MGFDIDIGYVYPGVVSSKTTEKFWPAWRLVPTVRGIVWYPIVGIVPVCVTTGPHILVGLDPVLL